MPTLEEIGKAAKAKYPQYQGKTDTEVGEAIVKKYPEYQSRVTPSDTRSTYQKAVDKIPDIFQTVGNIAATPFGKPARVAAGGITRAAGEAVRQGLSPETSSIGDAAKIVQGLLQGKKIGEQILSPEEQAAAEYKLSKEGATSQLGSLAGQAALGAGSTAVGEYVVGPAIEKAGQVVGKVTAPITKKIDEGVKWLQKKGLDAYASTFKDNQTAQNIINRSGGPQKLAKEMMDNKIPVTKSAVQKEIAKLNSQYEDAVTNKLKTLGQTRNIDVDSVIDDVIKEAQKIYTAPGGAISPTAQKELQDFTNYVNAFKGQYTGPKSNINLVNEFRKYLDKAYSGKNPANIVDGEKLANDMLANALRRRVQENAPITQNFFKRYSLLKKAEEIFYKEPKVGLSEYVGAAVGNIPGFIGSRLLKSPGAYRGVASLLAGEILPEQAAKTGGDFASRVVAPTAVSTYINPRLQALQRAIDQEQQSKVKQQKLPSPTR